MGDNRRIAKLPRRVEHWDLDEPGVIIVTLHYGWSFWPGEHLGVSGFDSKKEALEGVADSHPCRCHECKAELKLKKEAKAKAKANAITDSIIDEILAKEKK